ncbi:hypothetical protein L1276_003722 [Flavobacterium sp. HSC-32F16]|uniref:hypothetical protein n=1 Tax=Flavobacterium sp. HSC-32F16 TaxID=2910964 RepID=UPI0020A54516|nr:hypothetical protein [Flavobacterium sp. HSC-32F16]MCP2028552.1 hypothetical protein [Flavobacterium sp. HSC-32F16]
MKSQAKSHITLLLLKFSVCLLYMMSEVCYSQAKNNIADVIADNVQTLTKDHHLDNVYIQTSKNIYETQEDLWFKAYVLDSQSFVPSLRSKILFVQLIDGQTDKVVWEEKYEIENGFVNGHIYIDDSLKPGSYSLAVYSSASFYNGTKSFNSAAKINILKSINDKINSQNQATQKETGLSFTLFPEGGNIVSGIQNKIAFKALDSKGSAVDVSGKLYENNIAILDFKSAHAGMGSFLFKPKSNSKYHIELSNKINYPLPQIFPQGTILHLLSNDSNFAVFKVQNSDKTIKKNVFLRVQSRGTVYSVAIGILEDELTIKIPLKELPQGISEVTLFNENVEPIAERLIYVNQQKKLNIEGVIDKNEYQKREKATLKIKVTDENRNPVIAHLGVSVVDQLYINKTDSRNIMTHYYLSSELNGQIYDPGYYFNKNNANRESALDLLLLTQGWRRYVWNENNLKEHNALFKTILSDSISGNLGLENPNKKSPEEISKIVMVFTSNPSKGQDVFTANPNGSFAITSNHLKMGEGQNLFIKPMTAEKPKYIIKLKDNSFDVINSSRKQLNSNFPLEKIVKENFDDTSKIVMRLNHLQKLDEVVVGDKNKKVFRNKYLGTLDSLSRLNSRNSDFVCLEGGPSRPILNCFMNNHHEGKTRAPKNGEKVVVLLGKNREILGTDYPHQNYYGTREIIYKSPDQDLTEEQLLQKFNLKMIKGYYGKREFYEAVYDKVTINDPFPDYRNTLFWKPDVVTNEQGEAVIDFYCSDINTVFLGQIEAVNGTGLLGMENFKLKVVDKGN